MAYNFTVAFVTSCTKAHSSLFHAAFTMINVPDLQIPKRKNNLV